MRILLTGGTGQVGWELRRTLSGLGRVWAPGREALDLREPASLRATFRRITPDVVVNAAAYTDVDRAESEPDVARAVNAEAPAILAAEVARTDALMVHYSTDYVFGGSGSRPHRESDPTGPMSVYGRTKLEGEEAVRRAGSRHLILRTSWVFGLRSPGFLPTMIDLFRKREEVRVVRDQVGSPTWSRSLAQATSQLVHALAFTTEPRETDARLGTYHVAGAGEVSRFEFAAAIRDLLAAGPLAFPLLVERLLPATTAEFPTLAQRPAYGALDSREVERAFGIRIPPWREQLALCLEEFPAVIPGRAWGRGQGLP